MKIYTVNVTYSATNSNGKVGIYSKEDMIEARDNWEASTILENQCRSVSGFVRIETTSVNAFNTDAKLNTLICFTQVLQATRHMTFESEDEFIREVLHVGKQFGVAKIDILELGRMPLCEIMKEIVGLKELKQF